LKQVSLAALLTLACATSCYSTTEGEEVATVSFQPGVTTKEEVIQALGPPRGIRRQGSDKVYVFSFGDLNGTGYGLGSPVGAFLLFQATHTGYDNLEVVIGPDRLVRTYRLAVVPRDTPKWVGD